MPRRNRHARRCSRRSCRRCSRWPTARCFAAARSAPRASPSARSCSTPSMTGYQEILTDPSYAGQIVTLTYPHIGNVGVNAEDVGIAAHLRRGPRDPRPAARSRRTGAATGDLVDVPRAQRTSSASPTSTRASSRACCARRARRTAASSPAAALDDAAEADAASRARARRRRWRGSTSRRSCRCAEPYEWTSSTWALGAGYRPMGRAALPRRRLRLRRQAQHPAHARRARLPGDRGAGADARARRARDEARRRVPVATVPAIRSRATTRSRRSARSSTPACRCSASASAISCSGLAAGGRTLKMKFGHHGANHPVLDQRHRAGADHQPEPRLRGRSASRCRRTCASRTCRCSTARLQGIARTDKPAFCFQGHPEASPGPHDVGLPVRPLRQDDGEEVDRMPKRTDIQSDPHHRRRPDHHRAGVRVRLFGRAGVQGAARGGLPRHPGQLAIRRRS